MNGIHAVAVEVSNAGTPVVEYIKPTVAHLRFEASATP